MAFSFRVTNSGMVRTIADHRLPDTKGVLEMLKWVEKFMARRAHNYSVKFIDSLESTNKIPY